MSQLRILIAGGGTGGHIIPALAVARELVSRQQAQILFVGTPRGMESRLVPQAGFDLKLIQVGPLNQVSLLTRLRTLAQLPLSIVACTHILRDFRPDAVFGVGGYASGPAMGAAILLRIPTMAFEPNAIPGMANRLIGKRVQAAAVNFPPAAKWFRNAEVTGIPVRSEFFSIGEHSPVGSPRLLVFGGSQGARIFNMLLPQLAPALLAAVPSLTILHQAGARHAEATRAAYAASGADPARWQLEAFLDDMAGSIARAHLILARSGASTVAELAASGKPALLIPFAAAADNHQRSNAEVMVQAGAAVMLEERQLGDLGNPGNLGNLGNPADPGHIAQPGLLLKTLVDLLANPGELQTMGQKAKSQARPDAAERIASRLISLASRKQLKH